MDFKSGSVWKWHLCVCSYSEAYLEAASFGGVQDEELFKQILTVRRHVERNPVFTTQHTLSQFLVVDKDMESQQQILKTFTQFFLSHP